MWTYSNYKNTEYSFWIAIKEIKKQIIQISPIRREEGGWARDNKQTENLVAEHLETFFQHNEEEAIRPVTVKEAVQEIR